MDSLELLDVIKVIEEYVNRIQPDIVYTHHVGDLNIDHQRIHEAVITACRPIPDHPVKTLLFFEVPSSTEWYSFESGKFFAPNWYMDISDVFDLKLKALKVYQAEMRVWPHPRSLMAVEHLARWRGASVGVEAAEAFMVGRNLIS
jgi:N-acetylglucosamine malate deacetylase 1